MEGIRDAVHLCIDMQNIFARGGVWETPWRKGLCRSSRISARATGSAPYSRASSRPSSRRTGAVNGRPISRDGSARRAAILHPARSISCLSLRDFRRLRWSSTSPPIRACFGLRLGHLLVERHVGTVVVSGAETDVCVLSTRARCGRSRLPRRHRAGRAVQLFRHRPRCADDDVPNAVSRADRSGRGPRTVRDVAPGLGAPRPRPTELPLRLRR